MNEHQAQERNQQQELQPVEHWNLILTVPVKRFNLYTYAFIEGKWRKLYPTGIEQEPWITNISRSSSARKGH